MKIILTYLFVFFTALFVVPVLASGIKEGHGIKQAVGWHWYNESYPENKQEEKQEKADEKEDSAMAQLAILRNEVQEAKAKAILYPTLDNVRSYVVLQNLVMEKARMFTRAWKQVLLEYPELDYGVLHPTQSNAQHVLHTQTRIKEDAAIKYYSEKYGLLFFYRGESLLDQELAPTIEKFSRDNNVALIPVAVDGKNLATFATSHTDRGQAERLGVKHFPALILVDPKNQKVRPLHYGFIADSELRRRFLQIATNFQEGG